MPVISPFHEEILKVFPSVPDAGFFYLTGGTALAHFYLQHRKSYDLDFFTSEENLVDSFSRNVGVFLEKQNLKVERRRGMKSFVELFVSRRN